MALPPPSASNDEVRTAIRYIRKYTGHKLTFKRGKKGYDWGKGIVYDTWPSAVCRDCGTRFVWDTYESHGLQDLNYKNCGPDNYWRTHKSGKKHIDEMPTCGHVKMFEALE